MCEVTATSWSEKVTNVYGFPAAHFIGSISTTLSISEECLDRVQSPESYALMQTPHYVTLASVILVE